MNAEPGAAGNDRPEAVNADDIRGLRVETGRIADQLETMATKEEVAGKASTIDVNEVRRLAGRANINSTLAVAAFILVLIFGGLFWNAQRIQHHKDLQITHDRRAADCASIADFGDLVKQGVTAIVVTPDRQAALDDFVAKYDASIDASIVKARAKKGYSADCSVIGNPPKAGG